ncbi:rRNA methyltransferase 3, mitochondrial [Ostrinia furnacalis]|uniref:rRNA methyltransferase 3, mitochondrial n=1 Tax=Ostrinia furnacalis TaxID=93504 RepID=UPI00104029B6|nr:rRNA methyltransferase 3, mitochondrial [Ostrinia furnacalis]
MSRALNLISQIVLQKPQPSFGSVRLYARWMNRNPAKVLLPFEPESKPNLKKEKVISLDPSSFKKFEDKPQVPKQPEKAAPKVAQPQKKPKEIKSKRDEVLKKRLFYLSQKKVFDDNNDIIFEKLKENDGRISNLLVKLKSKKDRQRMGQVLVEGWRMIVDGLEAKCKLNYVIFSQTEDLNNLRPFLPKTGVVFYKIPYKEIKLWSDLETSPGIFGVFEMPKPENVKQLSKPLPFSLICDNIRVPGNLGAILRVAVGSGCGKVLLSKGCVDLWDPKVIRSAAGAHFRLPIHSSVEWEEMPKLLEEDTSIFIADSNARVYEETSDNLVEDGDIPVLPYYGVQFPSFKHVTLIIGGETEGISENSYELAAQKNGLRLNIPLQRGVDSLNTGMALSVIAFEIRRQLIEAWTKAKNDRIAAHAT